ncbi:peptide deformylase, partial [Cobetia marina]
KPDEEVTEEIKQKAADMIETMYDENGVGLAATQVNFHQRLVVIDVSDTRDQPLVLINPTIIDTSGVEISEEGCLSVPETNAEVERAE